MQLYSVLLGGYRDENVKMVKSHVMSIIHLAGCKMCHNGCSLVRTL